MEEIILKYSEASAYFFRMCIYICVCMSVFVYFYSIVCSISIAM